MSFACATTHGFGMECHPDAAESLGARSVEGCALGSPAAPHLPRGRRARFLHVRQRGPAAVFFSGVGAVLLVLGLDVCRIFAGSLVHSCGVDADLYASFACSRVDSCGTRVVELRRGIGEAEPTALAEAAGQSPAELLCRVLHEAAAPHAANLPAQRPHSAPSTRRPRQSRGSALITDRAGRATLCRAS